MKRTALCIAAVLSASAGMATAAQQGTDYPARPIRVLIPYAAGGATDIVARILGPKMYERMGQPIVIDNRAGAAGNLAMEMVAQAQPDGYTLFVGNISTNSINPILFKSKIGVDAGRDLAGITLLASIPNLIIVGPKLPANSLKEAIAYAKERPGQLNYSAPLGSYSHLDMLAFQRAAGIRLVHVPSKGAGETLPLLMRGETHMTESNVASNLGAIRAGQIKALATTATKRLSELPEVPTMAEAGFPGIGSLNWNGLFAPRKTPKAVIDKLHKVAAGIMSEPDMQEFMAKRAIPVAVSASPAEFDAYVRSERERWAKVVADNNVKID
ncbi:MAG TPA: tripartite tricarboxylate transporter substrate binding protein [Burkholderiales bacterium]|nr:tripartite tricarboxylate transporter substrate binding protein [Burkholderiales bacterium]